MCVDFTKTVYALGLTLLQPSLFLACCVGLILLLWIINIDV